MTVAHRELLRVKPGALYAAINGLDAEVFATVMHAYKAGDMEHPVMQMVAGRLDGEQIASLAVYFATLTSAD